MDVLFQVTGSTGEIILNRPKALNALNGGMVDAITAQLLAWVEDDRVIQILIRAAEGKAFCAGGDIRAMYDEGPCSGLPTPGSTADMFFRKEYFMNHLIHTYPKPYVALIDGICMGGGLGISVHGSHRVVTENALMAMPETAIGLFPDVGGTYFLNACPGHVGRYLGLTGARVGAGDALYAGLATHYCPADHLGPLRDQVVACETTGDLKAVFDKTVDCPGKFPLIQNRVAIDHHFALETVADILASLQAKDGVFERETLALFAGKSPTSLKVTLEQLRRGQGLSIDAAFAQEFVLTQHFMAAPDFFEGVRALLVDKDKNPRWQPDSLDKVGPVTAYFDPKGLKPLDLWGGMNTLPLVVSS